MPTTSTPAACPAVERPLHEHSDESLQGRKVLDQTQFVQAMLTLGYLQQVNGKWVVTETGRLAVQEIQLLLSDAEFDTSLTGEGKPRWVETVGGGGHLILGGHTVKKVRSDAFNQLLILRELERHGWPVWLENPLAYGKKVNRKKQLRDTVGRLNQGLINQVLRFHVRDGCVCWEIVD